MPTGGAVLSCPALPTLGHCHRPSPSPEPGVTAEPERSKAVKKREEEASLEVEALPLPPKPKPEGDSSSSALALEQLLHVLFFPSFPFLSLPVEVIQKVLLSPGTDLFFAWSLVYPALFLCIASGTARVFRHLLQSRAANLTHLVE